MPSQKLGIDWPATASIEITKSGSLSFHTAQAMPPRTPSTIGSEQARAPRSCRSSPAARITISIAGRLNWMRGAEVAAHQIEQEVAELHRDRLVEMQLGAQHRLLLGRRVEAEVDRHRIARQPQHDEDEGDARRSAAPAPAEAAAGVAHGRHQPTSRSPCAGAAASRATASSRSPCPNGRRCAAGRTRKIDGTSSCMISIMRL